jgi:PAS domain S-box-containing protein
MAQFDVDLVLMELRLTGAIDAVQTAETIRRQYEVPIVFLAACADLEIIRRAQVSAPQAYILKPLKDEELRVAVEMALYPHQVERKLKNSERWLTATLRSIGDAVIATDAEWHVRFINPRAENLTGWKAEQAIGRELSEVLRVSLTSEPRPLAGEQSSAAGGKAEGVLITRDGREVSIEERSTTIRDERGCVIGTVIGLRERY